MTLQPLPSIERLAIAFLIEADINGDRIHTDLPADPAWPILQVRRIPGSRPVMAEWLDQATLQVDAIGERLRDRQATEELAQLAYVTLLEMPGIHDLGVVTGVLPERGVAPLPDEIPTRPRFSFDVAVWFHPHPDGGS